MLNFINNKFRKIIISNIILGHCFTNNIYAGYKDKNKDNEINKKKGYSGKNKNNEETITDTENQDNNTNTNNNDNKNINNENLIKNKKEKLLRILEEIRKDNNYLSDKIEDKIINNLKNKIENINNSNISNIENELNDLRNTINSRFDKIKENYINTVTNINNSIEILENYNKGKYQLQKYTLNIDEVNKTKFENIKDLNDTLEGIKKGYNDSINEIVSKLKSEFGRLKNKKLKDKELDVKEEDFDNLTEATKIIDIDKKLFIYDLRLKGDKTEIINKINSINEKLEKYSELLNLLKIKFIKETNLNNKNIEDLCNLYEDLLDIDAKLTDYLNKKKIELTEKYKNLYKIYEKYKTKWELKEISINFNINDYNLDNYKDFEKEIKKFEKNIKNNIDKLEQKLNKEYKEIIENCKNKNLKYKDFSLKNVDNLEEKYKYLENLDKYLEGLKKSLKELEYELKFSVNTKILTKDELENYHENIEELQKKLEKNGKYDYSGIHRIGKNKILNNYTQIGNNVEKNLNAFIKDNLNNIQRHYDIGINQGKGSDSGAIRRKFYEESTDFILNKLKINGVKLIETKKDCLVFNTINKNNKTEYNMFSTEDKLESCDYENYIKLLALFCVNSLQNSDGCNTLFLNLNPLIYKIMLNYSNLEKTETDDSKIKKKLSNILNYDDLRYYDCNTWSYLLTRKEIKDDERNDFDEGVEEIYNNMIKDFANQFPKIQKFYYYLKYYFKDNNFNIFKNFSKNDYWKLKYFLEGENIIKYDKLINCIDKEKCLAERFIEIKGKKQEIISENNAKKIYDIFLDILKNFSNEELLSFLRWSTGSKSLPICKKIHFKFVKTLDYDHNLTLLSAHSCFYYFKIAINTFGLENKNFNKKISDKEKEIIKKKLEYELKYNIKCNDFTIA